MTIPFMLKPGKSVAFYIEGVPYTAHASVTDLDAVLAELRNTPPDTDLLISLVAPGVAIANTINEAVEAVDDYLPRGMISVTSRAVRYNGEALGGVLVDRILNLLAEGFDIMPMVRFMENLFQNPADFARDELYLWLEASDLPITEDGHFLAYKNVKANFRSITGGVVDNSPGQVVTMPRLDVDDDRNRTCSAGLHFCSKDYLPHFAGEHGCKTVLLKINPADVVSIPSDYGNAKGRAWKYEVLQEVDFEIGTKVWPAIVAGDGGDYDPDLDDQLYDDEGTDEMFDATSELAGALFKRLKEIGITDRDARLDWAATELGFFVVYSFNDLTVEEVETLLDAANDTMPTWVTNVTATEAADKRNARAAEINRMGIISLRRAASAAGLKGAWKGASKATLQAYLLNKG